MQNTSKGEPRRVVRRRLDPYVLRTKCFTDSILAALAIWALTSLGPTLCVLTECTPCDPGCSDGINSPHCNQSRALCSPDDSVYGRFGAECETLNLFRIAVLCGGILLLCPKVLATIELTWVVRRAYLENRAISYTKDPDELFAEMFAEIPFKSRRYNGFLVRLVLAPFNLLSFLLLFLKCCTSKRIRIGSPPTQRALVENYLLSLPSLCLPFALLALLPALMKEAQNPADCFLYSAALQIYAFLGTLISNEIFNREANIGALLKSGTTNWHSESTMFNNLTNQLVAASRRKNPTVNVRYNFTQKITKEEELLMIAELLKHIRFNGPWTIRFEGFGAQGLSHGLRQILRKAGDNVTFVFDRFDIFSDDDMETFGHQLQIAEN